ncbi:hypothetical protein [Paenibacillus xerothermodurans]|uniref:Uncharacterized protein n=1 Tax=Paenibacillus xerothermodurans TaxID=1977292 RepID=A0A2W1P233_PAEXE|nr:hypothetical protein [Paenibacillus xerothermodurans]PZE21198.1 hypothetical protein CBW46_007440 [Paenibacillus xerothermodurans]
MTVSVAEVRDEVVSPWGHREKVALLRQYESSCYQSTLYMLKDGRYAMEAAKQAFICLYRTDEWFELGEKERMNQLKRQAIKQALEYSKQLHSQGSKCAVGTD